MSERRDIMNIVAHAPVDEEALLAAKRRKLRK